MKAAPGDIVEQQTAGAYAEENEGCEQHTRAEQDEFARAEAVNQKAGDRLNQNGGKRDPAARLGAGPAEFADEIVIEERHPIKGDPYRNQERQKCGGGDVPAVEYSIVHNLEVDSGANFDLASWTCGTDDAESRGSERLPGQPQICVIDRVEKLAANLQVATLFQLKVAQYGKVEGDQARAVQYPYAFVAELKGRGLRKRGSIEPRSHHALPHRQDWDFL